MRKHKVLPTRAARGKVLNAPEGILLRNVLLTFSTPLPLRRGTCVSPVFPSANERKAGFNPQGFICRKPRPLQVVGGAYQRRGRSCAVS
ncbi:hypothetical protein SRHO_G00189690 [Serrasalmus rhombeus]